MQKALLLLIQGLFKFMGLIPRPLAIAIASSLGAIWFAFDKRHRTVAIANLSSAYAGEKDASELRKLVKQVFKQIARIPFEIGWSLSMNPVELMQYCDVSGLTNLQKAHAKGKGILILTLHLGNWELLPSVTIYHGYKSNFVYRPLEFKAADVFFLQYRSRCGATPIPKKKSMRRVLRPLKKRQSVGILLDQHTHGKAGIDVDFFGRPASTNKGLALIALKTEAPVIPAFAARCGMRYKIHFGPEIPLIKTDQKEKDVLANTQQYNHALEAIIRRHPEQWFWVHQRWKTR